MPGRDHQHHPVGSQFAELQMRVVCLPADETDADLAAFHLVNRFHTVADIGTDLDVRVLGAKSAEQRRKKLLAGNRAGGNGELTDDGRLVSGDFPPSLAVQVEYALSVGVKPLARV